MVYKGTVAKIKKDVAVVEYFIKKPIGGCWGGAPPNAAGPASLKKVECKNDLGAKEGDKVMIEIPDALQGLNAFIYFLPAILSLIIFMGAKTYFGREYIWYVFAGGIISFILLRAIADKIIVARTKGDYFDSKITKIL